MLNDLQLFLRGILADYTDLPEAVQWAAVVLVVYALPRALVALGFDLAWFCAKTGVTGTLKAAGRGVRAWWHRPSPAEARVARVEDRLDKLLVKLGERNDAGPVHSHLLCGANVPGKK